MRRRHFLKSAALAGAAAAIDVPSSLIAAPTRPQSPDMLYRDLGRTGEKVSAIGLGGAHIGYIADDAEATRLIRTAIDRGITFMDNSWDYNGGRSEERMGNALLEGYRDKVFLMTKTDSHSAAGFTAQLNDSLRRLQTPTIDLVQFHEVVRPTDPEAIFAPGGALEAALAARQAGKLRYIGFTGHKDPSIHLHMLEVARQHNFHFDTLQMPINVLDAHFRSFQHQVIPVAQREGVGILAMKTFGFGAILQASVASPIEMLHYSLTLPVSVVITGMDSMPRLDQALTAARTFKPMDPAADRRPPGPHQGRGGKRPIRAIQGKPKIRRHRPLPRMAQLAGRTRAEGRTCQPRPLRCAG
jgi:predicted aldo/keto reductase-like oxidoreductase